MREKASAEARLGDEPEADRLGGGWAGSGGPDAAAAPEGGEEGEEEGERHTDAATDMPPSVRGTGDTDACGESTASPAETASLWGAFRRGADPSMKAGTGAVAPWPALRAWRSKCATLTAACA